MKRELTLVQKNEDGRDKTAMLMFSDRTDTHEATASCVWKVPLDASKHFTVTQKYTVEIQVPGEPKEQK